MERNLPEDELGFYEILHPLIRRWKWIAGGILSGIFIAALITLLMPKQYETSLLLNIGTVHERTEKLIEDPDAVARMINSNSFQEMIARKAGIGVSSQRLSKMIQADTGTNRAAPLVTVTARADSAEEALRLAKAIGEEIVQRHASFYEGRIEANRIFKVELEKHVQRISNDMDQLKKKWATYRSSSHDIPTEILLQTKVAEIENKAFDFEGELQDLSAWFSVVSNRKTSIVSEPVPPKSPSSPNLGLNLLVAAIVSTFLMISFALLHQQFSS